MTSLAQRVAALQDAPLDDLVTEYERLYERPPYLRRRSWLLRRVAWGIQAEALGGLSKDALKRIESLIEEIDVPLTGDPVHAHGTLARARDRDGLRIGNTITRQYQGREFLVRVVPGGFEYEGIVYKSLSAVAKVITGTRWNGRLFFGVANRKSKS